MVSQLTRAASVTMLLADQGIQVLAALANGRRPLLIVDHMPKDTVATVKRRYPGAFGRLTAIYAAEYYGCQLETIREVAGPARLEVVRGH
ncbi:hypothetical protein RDV84_00325 [Lysobacter yananisis]|uniref:Uncharacterized protein n=1 Tax=Lysobacter yananisis TaxID=1003114 RepID=A0ABY9P8J9_9GAMM|nr:hypothetical protein [Lysobacter yananisis]WMT03336.1 hypothetical protein RDV84_00325 [Lysobacter yananisis]